MHKHCTVMITAVVTLAASEDTSIVRQGGSP